MDPDLMGSPCLQAALHMGIAGVPGQDGPVGHRLPAIFGVDSHPFPVHRMPSNGSADRAAVLPEAPHRHRLIGPGKGVVLELSGQSQVGPVMLGGDNQAGGVPVDAVNNAGAQLAVDSRQ